MSKRTNPKMDLNIDNYSIRELFEVLEVDARDGQDKIISKTDQYIKKFTQEKNIIIADFFTKAKTFIIDHFADQDDLVQSLILDDNKRNEIHDSKLLISRDKEINKQTNISISQDKLNPNLKNTISRMLVIDSQFRQVFNDENPSSPTDFTMDLSEPLHDLINLRLFSIQIPYTWYTIDEAIGTNVFYYNEHKITIEPGNYKPTELIEVINDELDAIIGSDRVLFSYNPNNCKTTITNLTESTNDKIVFFDFTRFLNSKTNNNLGYLLGFQKMEYSMGAETIRGEGIVDLYGPKYLLIVVDDYNQNHVNSGLINVYDNPNVSLKMPSYFNTTLPVRTDENNNTQFLPESPRQMTQSQLYALNTIQEQKDNPTSNFRANAPVTTDVFGFMPIKHGEPGTSFIEFGGSLQSNVRHYFGPVNINRLRIRLIDDKGYVVNLNGANWSFGIVCETLYQY